MANFPVNPFRFLPEGMTVDDGPQERLVRGHMAVPPEAPLFHGEYAIAVANWHVPDLLRPEMLEELVNILGYDHHIKIRSARSSPFGIGLIKFSLVVVRDAMVEGDGYDLDGYEVDTRITFVRHDAALNMLGQERWALFLGFPFDYQTYHFIQMACSGFCRLMSWHDPNGDLSRVLVRVWLVDDDLVPRSLIVR
jgi:hypothetical protein